MKWPFGRKESEAERAVKEQFGNARNYLDRLPGNAITADQYFEVSQLIGATVSYQQVADLFYATAARMAVEGKDHRVELRRALRSRIVEVIKSPGLIANNE